MNPAPDELTPFFLSLLLTSGSDARAQSLAQPDVPTALYVRQGGKIVDAPAADFAVAMSYHAFPDKGPVRHGQRLTLLTASTRYQVGQPVRVLHVLESVRPRIGVYVMGPKAISDEYVDGRLVTPKGPMVTGYDGAVINRPIADFNYEISSYTFDRPGQHTIEWKGFGGLGADSVQLQSNLLIIDVVD